MTPGLIFLLVSTGTDQQKAWTHLHGNLSMGMWDGSVKPTERVNSY